MESVEEPPIPECIDSSCIAAHHGVDDDKASAVKEQNLLEHTTTTMRAKQLNLNQ